jgi:hypothetical protein
MWSTALRNSQETVDGLGDIGTETLSTEFLGWFGDNSVNLGPTGARPFRGARLRA